MVLCKHDQLVSSGGSFLPSHIGHFTFPCIVQVQLWHWSLPSLYCNELCYWRECCWCLHISSIPHHQGGYWWACRLGCTLAETVGLIWLVYLCYSVWLVFEVHSISSYGFVDHKTNSTLAFITTWVVYGMASVVRYNATFGSSTELHWGQCWSICFLKVPSPDPIICHHLTESLHYRWLHIGQKSCGSLSKPRDSLHPLFHLFDAHCHECKLWRLLGTEGHEFHCVNIMWVYLTHHAWHVGGQWCFSSDIITHTLLCVFARWPLTLVPGSSALWQVLFLVLLGFF